MAVGCFGLEVAEGAQGFVKPTLVLAGVLLDAVVQTGVGLVEQGIVGVRGVVVDLLFGDSAAVLVPGTLEDAGE